MHQKKKHPSRKPNGCGGCELGLTNPIEIKGSLYSWFTFKFYNITLVILNIGQMENTPSLGQKLWEKLKLFLWDTKAEKSEILYIIPGKPAQKAAILHSEALIEPGAKTVPTTISPTSIGFNFVFSITACINNQYCLENLDFFFQESSMNIIKRNKVWSSWQNIELKSQNIGYCYYYNNQAQFCHETSILIKEMMV